MDGRPALADLGGLYCICSGCMYAVGTPDCDLRETSTDDAAKGASAG